MARFFGSQGGPLALGLFGIVVLAPLAVFEPLAAALTVTGLAGLATGLATYRARKLAQRCDKLSGEVDVLSKRLVRLEARAAAPGPPPLAVPHPETAASIEEVTVEIGLLSGIVRDLAAVVANQDGEIARLKAEPPQAAPAPEPRAAREPRPAPAPPAAVPAIPAAARAVPPAASRAPAVQTPVPATHLGDPLTTPSAVSFPAQPAARSDEPSIAPSFQVPSVQPEAPPRTRPIPPRRPAAFEPEIGPAPLAAPDAIVLAAFDGEGVEVHLQPIVTLPQRKVATYEALARLRVGEALMAPEAFLPVLERHGRSTDLDRRMLQRVATVARHLGSRGSEAGIAYALSPLSLYEPGFLRSVVRLVAAEPALTGRLMLALPQASWRNLDREQVAALTAMRARIGFILDRPTDLRFETAALAERGIAQVKVPAAMLLRAGNDPRTAPDIALEDLVAALGRGGVRLVAEGVEREADVPDLIDLDIPFAQGGVFAPPRAVRSEVLASAPEPVGGPVPAAAATEEPEPEPPPQRRPFRDFLRRAS